MDKRISAWLSGTPLTALYKKQGGGGVRTIAVGEVLRRLISRDCCAAVESKLPEIFLPYGQVGFGIPDGLEAAVHSLSSFIDTNGDNPTLCCLKLDMANAFNSCHRIPVCNAYIGICPSYLVGFNGVITRRPNLGLVRID